MFRGPLYLSTFDSVSARFVDGSPPETTLTEMVTAKVNWGDLSRE